MTGKEMYNRFLKTLIDKEMTKKEFCEKTGVKQTALANWGTRGTMPSAELAIAIAKGLEITTDYLFGISDIPNPEKKTDLTDKELELIGAYRNMDSSTKDHVFQYFNFLNKGDN